MNDERPASPKRIIVILLSGVVFLVLILWSSRLLRSWRDRPAPEPAPEVVAEAGSSNQVAPPAEARPKPARVAPPEWALAAQQPQTAMKDKWGISISSVRLTAGGTALDVRYQVLDPVKASGMHKLRGETYLLDQFSGQNLSSKAPSQPLVTQELATGKTYFMMFPNTGGVVRKGGAVMLVVGGTRTERIVVE